MMWFSTKKSAGIPGGNYIQNPDADLELDAVVEDVAEALGGWRSFPVNCKGVVIV